MNDLRVLHEHGFVLKSKRKEISDYAALGSQSCCLCTLPSIDVKCKGHMRTFWFPSFSDVDLPKMKARLRQDQAMLAHLVV